MLLNEKALRGMIEFTLLHNTDTADDIRAFARMAREGGYATAYVMPCFSGLMAKELAGSSTLAGGAVSFPTGSDPLSVKVEATRWHVSVGAGEIDYVINLNMLKSGDYDFIAEEARQIIRAAEGRPVKAIIEVTLLTDEEIRKVSKCLMDAGVDYIKTGTGTQPNPTTVEHVRAIHEAVGSGCKIKAAGGIRTLDTVVEMIRLGVTRFGISWKSAVAILDELKARWPEGIEI
ncbi:MAG: deoxyribose-phosphate aldolase [Clostridia bacterium]|nr:deoxyribose-phosphate aldolase [Clostridia bacterium]